MCSFTTIQAVLRICSQILSSPSGPFFWEEADAKPSTQFGYGTASPDKVWRIDDLQILHNIASPVLICALGQAEDSSRYAFTTCIEQSVLTRTSKAKLHLKMSALDRPGGVRFFKETFFQNLACLNLLGKARPLEEYTALVVSMPDWERSNRRDWTDVIKQVHEAPLQTHDDGDAAAIAAAAAAAADAALLANTATSVSA